MGDNQVFLVLVADLDGRLPEKEGVVSHPRLHRHVFLSLAGDLPRLVVQLGGVRQRGPRSGGDYPPTLHGLAVDGGWWKIEPHVSAFLTFLRSHQDPVTDDD